MWVSAVVDAGQVVAFTEVVVTASRAAEQHDTVVLPSYRRRGLARCVKADMVLWLRSERDDVRTVTVTYAVANIGMHRVNYDVGFRERRRRNLVRLPIG